ncbi:MAG: hypothetical protein GY835_10665 [bacterium]|nr:hypothetical protein [bacterium]
MTKQQIESDLDFVKDKIEAAERGSSPGAFYILWAVIVLAGYLLEDFAPHFTGLYWCIAGPAGGLVSGFLGYRYAQRRGQIGFEIGRKNMLHWGGMLACIALLVLLCIVEHIPGQELSRLILIIIAFGWWTAGVHFDRLFLWLGGIMGLGFLGTLVFDRFVWTSMGVLIAIVLLVAAQRRWSSR